MLKKIRSKLGKLNRLNPFPILHSIVVRLEPWGVLLALIVFGLEITNRVEERTVRAWQLLTTKAPGNSGKREALEYLNKEDGLICLFGSCYPRWKKQTPLIGIDLSAEKQINRTFLEGVLLVEADLRNAKFNRANLNRGNLKGGNLSGSNFVYAQLKFSDLSNTDLSGALVTDANLIRSKLSRANLTDSDFRRSDLSGSDLSKSILTDTDFNHTKLIKVNFSGASFRTFVFKYHPEMGQPIGHDFITHLPTKAKLSYADLSQANLGGVDLSEGDLRGAILVETNLVGANLSRANLRWAFLQRTDLRGADLRGANLSGATFDSAIYDVKSIKNACSNGGTRGLPNTIRLTKCGPT